MTTELWLHPLLGVNLDIDCEGDLYLVFLVSLLLCFLLLALHLVKHLFGGLDVLNVVAGSLRGESSGIDVVLLRLAWRVDLLHLLINIVGIIDINYQEAWKSSLVLYYC